MKKLLTLLCAVVCAAPVYAQTPGAPTFSPTGGTYSSQQSVTISCGGTTNGKMFYTTDGTTPDYTSTPYTAPVTVNATQTLKAICGVIATQAVNEAASTAGWKKPDCQAPGVGTNGSICVSDNPGGSGIPLASGLSQPNLGNGSSLSGYTTTGCMTNGGLGPCITVKMTPATTSQTNALWARSGGGVLPPPTWTVADSYVYYPSSNGTHVSAYEHDSQIFCPSCSSSSFTSGINYQFGMQCTKCDQSGLAQWDIGGTANTNWIHTGITQVFTQGTWHHIVKEEKRILGELNTLPCYGVDNYVSGHPVTNFPCQYYMRLKLDSANYDLQHGTCTGSGCSPSSFTACSARAAGSGQSIGTTGCTITTDQLEPGFGANSSDQYQIDSVSNTSSVAVMVDQATFTAYYDPSPVATAVYTFSGTPTANPATFSPVDGTTFTSTVSVTLASTTPSSTIYYTKDGTTPTTSSAGYSAPLTLSATTTVKALVTAPSMSNSSVSAATYTLTGSTVAATPTASPAAGTYFATQTVALATASSGATICYTTDGSTPAATTAGTCSAGTTYSAAVSVAASETIRALATKSGLANSPVAVLPYVISIPAAAQRGNIDLDQIKSNDRLGNGDRVQTSYTGLFSTFPSCTSSIAGTTGTVTDPTTTTAGAIEGGTGTATTPTAFVYCNGANWIVH